MTMRSLLVQLLPQGVSEQCTSSQHVLRAWAIPATDAALADEL